MAVFTTLAVACWFTFPKYRVVCLGGMIALGFAMVATGYHYLSDIIAGGYLGLVILVGTDRGLSILGGYGKTEG